MNSAVAEHEGSPPENPSPANGGRRLSSPTNKTEFSISSSSSSASSSSSPSCNGYIQTVGIPFAWERQPGIPKYLHSSSRSSPRSRHLFVISKHLPPPPPLPLVSTSRFDLDSIFRGWRKKTHERHCDPFFVAFLECSKDTGEGRWTAPTGCRSWTERLIQNLDRFNVSCKTSCAVVQSQVFHPQPYRDPYDPSTKRLI